MSRYVNADYIIKCAEMSFKNSGIPHCAFEKIKKWVTKANDITLCKDCAFYYSRHPSECGKCLLTELAVPEEGFCYNGKKR